MQTTNFENQKGFTLVEIAIVLVIIGLLLGGVLKGQELIENSKVKSVVADFDNIGAAHWAYRDRLGTYASGLGTDADFWVDLRTEGFIQGASTDTSGPEHALDGVFSYVEGSASTQTGSPKEICASNIEARIAANIDTKADDGTATTGSIQSAGTYDGSATAITICRELQ